ncbi:unnamed protein product [Strongylus vulgaris]|uniref:Uncharacterized protein n=1 Tax=Strongylus vulgaris TaxID=40348 RepID=A0A3P7LVK7_STRVU|nr:unnamed protein product [Strongylus vulgaris]
MSSNLPRIAARQANKISKANNPFMSTQTTDYNSEKAQNDRVDPVLETNVPEGVPVEKEDFSIAKFFGMRSLDKALIRNVRRLIEEERDRQIEFERMRQPRLNY